jgi:DNA mismatch repair protein MutS
MALIKEYFELTKKYHETYGEKMILLMQVGSFFEVYGKKDKTTGILHEFDERKNSNIQEFSRICELNIAEKNVCINDNEQIVMAGFKDIGVEKYLKKLQEAGYTAVVYTQEEQAKNTTRSLAGIFSPGTYFSNETGGQLTNNTTCIWLEFTENRTKLTSHSPKMIHVGIANIDIYTGKTTMFQFSEVYANNPTTYDELERFISIHCPSEAILISNLPRAEVEDILSYANIRAKKSHILIYGDHANSSPVHQQTIKNCEKQTYQKEILFRFYPTMDFDGFVHTFIYENHIATQAFCYLLDFVYQHNPHLVNKISEPIFENCSDRLILANHSLKQLNIIDDGSGEGPSHGRYSSVIKMLNLCSTPMGKRKFAYDVLNPTTNATYLEQEYNITDYLIRNAWNASETVFSKLKEMKDVSKWMRQIFMKKISPNSLFQMHRNLRLVQNLICEFYKDKEIIAYIVDRVSNSCNISTIDDVDNACSLICTFLTKNFDLEYCKDLEDPRDIEVLFIQRGIHEELDEKTIILTDSKCQLEAICAYLNQLIENQEKKGKKTTGKEGKGKATTTDYIKCHETEKNNFSLIATKRRSLLLKSALPNTPVTLEYTSGAETKTFSFQCYTDTIEFSAQSATNNIISCPQIDSLCKNICVAKTQLRSLVVQAYAQIVEQMESFQEQFERIVQFITWTDIMYCKMLIAKKYNYCKPIIDNVAPKSFIQVRNLRHCLIEQIQQDCIYVANDVALGTGNLEQCGGGGGGGGADGILLYGTNAVGKTSFIRAIGIAVLMAQAGLYVPATFFKFKPYKYIFTRILGNDNLFKGLSSFAVEMYELRTILRLGDANSLVLGDELCSGTESTSAISIFVAGIETLQKRGCSFIFATHLHEIVGYQEINDLSTVKQMHMAVVYDREKDSLVYDRKLREGPGTSSYGLEVCKSLQLPDDFLQRAQEIRIKYRPEQGTVLSLKSSHFNSKKLMGLCEKCGETMGTEVHHLQQQREANEDGIIFGKEGTPFHKNHPANLMTLCEKCHNAIHGK